MVGILLGEPGRRPARGAAIQDANLQAGLSEQERAQQAIDAATEYETGVYEKSILDV